MKIAVGVRAADGGFYLISMSVRAFVTVFYVEQMLNEVFSSLHNIVRAGNCDLIASLSLFLSPERQNTSGHPYFFS